VWQQDVRVIVMLTAEQEGGQLKAHNYWSNKQYGHLHLNALGEHKASLEPAKIYRNREQLRPALGQRRSTNPPKPTNLPKEATASPSSEQPYVTVRKFTLSNSDEPFERMREITQLQYSHWPDFGAPAHPTHLLGLIEQCDAVCRQVNGGSPSRPDAPNVRPIIVHCSAGCGRTGTFCTVDSVLDTLKRQRQSRNVRQTTPMEVDPRSPNSKLQGSPMSMDEKPKFAPKASDNKDQKEDGTWIGAGDLDLIEKTVADFRLQRLSMVQSLRQFVLCYESVLEWLLEQHPKLLTQAYAVPSFSFLLHLLSLSHGRRCIFYGDSDCSGFFYLSIALSVCTRHSLLFLNSFLSLSFFFPCMCHWVVLIRIYLLPVLKCIALRWDKVG
jgi:protein tyrosine phosphatase